MLTPISGFLAVTIAAGGIDSPCQVDRLRASDASHSARFGSPIRIDGDTMIVGARLEGENGLRAGAAYVFVEVDGGWIEQQKLVASDGGAEDRFGSAVDVDGDWAVAGAEGHVRGAVYVFHREGGAWTETQKIEPFDATSWFGGWVVFADDMMVVGAPLDDDGAPNGGAAYVYRRDGMTWVHEQKILSPMPETLQYFGSAEYDAGVLAFGTPNADMFGENSGAVFVHEQVDGLWTHVQTLSPSDARPDHAFGVVDIEGDVMVVSAGTVLDDQGEAYIFHHDGSEWVERSKLLTPDPGFQSARMDCVIDGGRILCGAEGASNGRGVAYLYERDEQGTWRLRRRFPSSDEDDQRNFGRAVALRGNVAMVGAPYFDGPGVWAGATYVLDFADCVTCVADLDDDGDIGTEDLITLLSRWNWPGGGYGDLDHDGTVGLSDVLLLLGDWGRCPPSG